MKLPKNFRQIGEIAGTTKIYIEDYVMTYMDAITKDTRTYVRGAILFGTMERMDNETYLFVNGAMEAQNIELDLDETVFDDAVWNRIYDVKDKYFKQSQVVGWYLSRTGMSIRLNDKIKKTHFENFPGDGKILYIRDSLDEEEAMYAYRGQDLVRQTGYYIYYVKNKEMQDYLIEVKQRQEAADSYERMLEQKRDEKIVRQSRYKLQQKKKKREFFLPKAIAAAVLMFFLGLSGTYVILGQSFLHEAVVGVFSDKIQSRNTLVKQPDQQEETITAIFKAEDNEEKKLEKKTEEDDVYTVKAGDTITKISMNLFHSKQYVDEIMKKNKLKPTDSIFPGQKLRIPSVKK